AESVVVSFPGYPGNTGRTHVEKITSRPRFSARVLFLGAAWCLAAFAPAAAGEKPATPPVAKGQRVFVCGHSFHVFIDGPLAEMARAAGITDHKRVGSQFLG